MIITYFGHSCFLVELGGNRLLFDPFISGNALAASVNTEAIRADYILASHGHADHVGDLEAIARRSDAVVVGAYELATYYGSKQLKYHPMNTGGYWNFGTWWVKCVPAVHSSSLPDGTYAGNPMGFVAGNNTECFYYSGDTALTLDMKLIAEEFTLVTAFLCLGDNFTMGIHDAVKAAQFVGCSHVTGMHFDTFDYIKTDHRKAHEAFGAAGITLKLPTIGESWEA